MTVLENLKAFTGDMPFILYFLGGTVLVQMFFGQKVTYYFLLLVLFSMVVINGDKIAAKFNR